MLNILYRRLHPDKKRRRTDTITTKIGKEMTLPMLQSGKPSIHMPKEAARIWLKVTDVRVERLQEITEDGCIAEEYIHQIAEDVTLHLDVMYVLMKDMMKSISS